MNRNSTKTINKKFTNIWENSLHFLECDAII